MFDFYWFVSCIALFSVGSLFQFKDIFICYFINFFVCHITQDSLTKSMLNINKGVNVLYVLALTLTSCEHTGAWLSLKIDFLPDFYRPSTCSSVVVSNLQLQTLWTCVCVLNGCDNRARCALVFLFYTLVMLWWKMAFLLGKTILSCNWCCFGKCYVVVL